MGDQKQKSLLISIVRLLSTNGYTMDDIANELALPPRDLACYIIGTKPIDKDTISDICSIYKVTKDDVKKYKQRLSLENKTNQ